MTERLRLILEDEGDERAKPDSGRPVGASPTSAMPYLRLASERTSEPSAGMERRWVEVASHPRLRLVVEYLADLAALLVLMACARLFCWLSQLVAVAPETTEGSVAVAARSPGLFPVVTDSVLAIAAGIVGLRTLALFLISSYREVRGRSL